MHSTQKLACERLSVDFRVPRTRRRRRSLPCRKNTDEAGKRCPTNNPLPPPYFIYRASLASLSFALDGLGVNEEPRSHVPARRGKSTAFIVPTSPNHCNLSTYCFYPMVQYTDLILLHVSYTAGHDQPISSLQVKLDTLLRLYSSRIYLHLHLHPQLLLIVMLNLV